jgi:hypothetical protein
MATSAQIDANRANAQLSTGPRSVEGKAAASRNSFKLGITAQSMIIPGEDPAELDLLTAEYEQQFQPVGPIETDLLQTVVRAVWMRRRYDRIEAAVITSRMAALKDAEHPLGAVFAQDSERGDTLAKIFRRQQAAQRDWYRAIDALRALQAQRRRSEAQLQSAAGKGESSVPRQNRVRFDRAPQSPAGQLLSPLTSSAEELTAEVLSLSPHGL